MGALVCPSAAPAALAGRAKAKRRPAFRAAGCRWRRRRRRPRRLLRPTPSEMRREEAGVVVVVIVVVVVVVIIQPVIVTCNGSRTSQSAVGVSVCLLL